MICPDKPQVVGKRVQLYGKTYESVFHKAPTCEGCAGSLKVRASSEENAKLGALCKALPGCNHVIWKEL